MGHVQRQQGKFQRQPGDFNVNKPILGEIVLLAMNLKMQINLFNASGVIFHANGPLQRQRGSFNAKRAANISTPPGGIERTLGGGEYATGLISLDLKPQRPGPSF